MFNPTKKKTTQARQEICSTKPRESPAKRKIRAKRVSLD